LRYTRQVAASEDLVRDTRARREALHQLILRMHRDRRLWERDIARLIDGGRLTDAQRRRLKDRLDARRAERG
jgi:hypothetical protein